jgi:hypothetical protein
MRQNSLDGLVKQSPQNQGLCECASRRRSSVPASPSLAAFTIGDQTFFTEPRQQIAEVMERFNSRGTSKRRRIDEVQARKPSDHDESFGFHALDWPPRIVAFLLQRLLTKKLSVDRLSTGQLFSSGLPVVVWL